jgi:hypothetical protein
MLVLQWVELPKLGLAWVGPTAPAPSTPLGTPPAINVVIGAQGRDGQQGLRGPPGDGAADPGDITLIFENQLL